MTQYKRKSDLNERLNEADERAANNPYGTGAKSRHNFEQIDMSRSKSMSEKDLGNGMDFDDYGNRMDFYDNNAVSGQSQERKGYKGSSKSHYQSNNGSGKIDFDGDRYYERNTRSGSPRRDPGVYNRTDNGYARNSNRYDTRNAGYNGNAYNRNEESPKRKGKSQGRRQSRKQKRNRIIAIIIIIVLVVALVVTGILTFGNKGGSSTENVTTTAGDKSTEAVAGDETTQSAGTVSDGRIELLAVGDVIGHDTILELAKTDNGYDFTSLFSILKDDISSTDITVVNMETPFGGTESGPYIGYPSFNTPDEMGDALIDTGFNVVQLASNHMFDSGTTGIDHTLNYWKKHSSKALAVGEYESEEARNKIPYLETEGVKIAFLNYTYGVNTETIPEGYEYCVTLLTDDNRDFISSQIKKASEECDFVVVLPHWGTEYQLDEPDETQVSWAQLFTSAGADLIIGTHPHVIEKIEWIESGGNKALCYYSLGNFVSNQQYTNTVLGAMAYVELVVDDQGIHIDENNAKVIPVVTHNDKTKTPTVIQTYYLADYTNELASVHDTKLSYESDFSVESMQAIVNQVFDAQWIKDRIN